jgi:hypothetical protein
MTDTEQTASLTETLSIRESKSIHTVAELSEQSEHRIGTEETHEKRLQLTDSC